jgi:hypothetical protein
MTCDGRLRSPRQGGARGAKARPVQRGWVPGQARLAAHRVCPRTQLEHRAKLQEKRTSQRCSNANGGHWLDGGKRDGTVAGGGGGGRGVVPQQLDFSEQKNTGRHVHTQHTQARAHARAHARVPTENGGPASWLTPSLMSGLAPKIAGESYPSLMTVGAPTLG